MGETQSRFSILEQLNDKKLEARKKLNQLSVEEELRKQQHADKISDYTNQIAVAEATYEADFQSWKKKQELEVERATKSLERYKNQVAEEIKERQETYKEDHKREVTKLEEKKKQEEYDYTKYVKSKDLKEKALKSEIDDYDKAIDDLQQMSSEQK